MTDLSPSPNIDRIRDQFRRQADAYTAQPSTHDEAALQALAAFSGASNTESVLDVACGPGLFTLELGKRCDSAVGFDATDAFLASARLRARELGIQNVRFEEGDVVQLPHADVWFDLVTCRAAFHHFPDPAKVVAEMTRVLKPGGRLLVADLLGNSDERAASQHDSVEKLCDPTHVHILSQDEFEGLFRGAGLTLVHRIARPLTHDLETWIDHGGPPPELAEEIRKRMRSWLAEDSAGLQVALEDGQIQFVQQTAAFLLKKAA